MNKWDETEVQAIERHMMDFIIQQKVPQKNDCIKCLEAENEALRDRSWKGVKNYVRNRITTLRNAKKASKTVKKRCTDEAANESDGGSSDKNQSQHQDDARLGASEGEPPVDIYLTAVNDKQVKIDLFQGPEIPTSTNGERQRSERLRST